MSNKKVFCRDCGSITVVSHSFPVHYICTNEDCKSIDYDNPTVGVAIVYYKDGKVFLGKRNSSYKSGDWCIPCGHLNKNEHPKDGATREFVEETSTYPLDIKTFAVTSNLENNTVGIYYITSEYVGSLKAADDLSELELFDINELPNNMAFKSDLEVIGMIKKDVMLTFLTKEGTG